MKVKLIKQGKKPKSLKKFIRFKILKTLFIVFGIVMIAITYKSSKDIMYKKSSLGKMLIKEYYTTEVLPQINIDQTHSHDEIYGFTILINNEIRLDKIIKDYVLSQEEYEMVSDLNPGFVFSTRGSSAYKSNFWNLSDAIEFDILNSVTSNTLESLICVFNDFSDPETMVKLYENTHEKSKYWRETEEFIVYGQMEESIFRVDSVEFIKDRNIESNEYTLVTKVEFDNEVAKNPVQGFICKKANIEQYYMNKPLTVKDIKQGYELMHFAYGGVLSDKLFENNFSIFETICIGKFPISNYYDLTSEFTDKVMQSREYMYIYFSFSPILLAMKSLMPIYIISICLILISSFIVSNTLQQKISFPLKVLPKLIRNGSKAFDAYSDIEEVRELANEIDVLVDDVRKE